MNQKPITDNFPTGYSPTHLQHNLEALAVLEPKLVQRISWPVDGSHVLFNGDNPIHYRLHFSLFPLDLSEAQCNSLIADSDPTKPFFVFGFGLGEIVDALLERFPGQNISVWEKDPWLVRLFLMQKDYSEFLKNGCLHLWLGSDLILHLSEIAKCTPVFHPFLKQVYHNEIDWFQTGIAPQRVLFNSGGLFVDQVVRELKERGYMVYVSDLNRISIEEIEYTVAQFRPQMLFSINYANGLAELCRKCALILVCWEIDPVIDRLTAQSPDNDHAFIFSYRKPNRDEFIKAGFKQAAYLPLAADPVARKPQILSAAEQIRYAAPVAFVGNVSLEPAEKYMRLLNENYGQYAQTRPLDARENPFERILALQAQDYSVYGLPEWFETYCGDFRHYFMERYGKTLDPVQLLAETAAARKRMQYLVGLAAYGVKVWGDRGWETVLSGGVRYMGPAGHAFELNKIYSGARINLDINRLYQADMINMRVFDILACGGFLLAEHSVELEELFQIGSELDTFHTLDELQDKVRYYLERPDEARAIALRGMQAVRDKHTIRQRVE
ncbi:MAG: hypothetical protein EHM45_11045, partial [Desulfobacteraceae bacterium]